MKLTNSISLTEKEKAVCVLLANSLNFNVEINAKEGENILRALSRSEDSGFPYNQIPSDISQIFGEINEACGTLQYPGGNPNNGKNNHTKIMLGNANSLLIRVRVIGAYQKFVTKTYPIIISDLQSLAQKWRAYFHLETSERDTIEVHLFWD